MKIVILDRKTLGFDIDVSIFEKFGSVISFDVTNPDETKQRIKDADIILTNKVYVGKEELENSKVKLVCITATGTNNVDLIYAKEANIASSKFFTGYSPENTKSEPVMGESKSGIAAGAKVKHKTFGVGTVVQIKGQGDSMEATIAFESQGIKKVMIAYEPIEAI